MEQRRDQCRRGPRLPYLPLPPPPPEGTSAVDIGKWLGYSGEILVLFETASGFAIFCYDGTQFFLPKAIENIWADFARDYIAKGVVMLREFQTFEDKASAINPDTGAVSDQLARMINKWLLGPRQKLAVGKLEYKTSIEASLGIGCLFNDAVMEVMWGLNNCVKSLIPDEEKLELTDELPMSKGVMSFLERNGFAVEPEVVNKRIIGIAHALYECDVCENKHARSLQRAVEIISEVVSSEINFDDWDSLKRASAVKMICHPKETYDDSNKMFSDEELSKLSDVAPSLEGKFYENTCLEIYKDIVLARGLRVKAQRVLKYLIKKARESCTAQGGQADLPDQKTSVCVSESV